MADPNAVSFCPVRTDLLSHVQFSNYSNIQYLDLHHTDEEDDVGLAEDYVEGSDTEEDDLDDDLHDIEPNEEASVEDDRAPMPNATEGEKLEEKDNKEPRSEEPEKPKQPEVEERHKKAEPAGLIPKKKAKNARKKEESKKKEKDKSKSKDKDKEKDKEKSKDKSKKHKHKAEKSKDTSEDAKREAGVAETHPKEGHPTAAEAPPTDSEPNEPPPAAADPTPVASHDSKEADSEPPPEPTAESQTEKEINEHPPIGDPETPVPSNEPANEAAPEPEQEQTQDADKLAPDDTTNEASKEASNSEPNEKRSESTPEPVEEPDTSPTAESSSESSEKQPSQEALPKTEDGLDNGVVAVAADETLPGEGIEPTATQPEVVHPQGSSSSGDNKSEDVPESEGCGEATTREPPDPTEESVQMPNTSSEDNLARDEPPSEPPDQALPKTELPREEEASEEETAEGKGSAADPIGHTAEESKIEDTSVEPTQDLAEREGALVTEEGGNNEDLSTSTEENEIAKPPDSINEKEAIKRDNDEKQEEKAPTIEQPSTEPEKEPTPADPKTSHEQTTPEESTNLSQATGGPVKCSDDTPEKPQANECASAEESEGNTEAQPTTFDTVDAEAREEDITEPGAPGNMTSEPLKAVSGVSASDGDQQPDTPGDTTTVSRPGDNESASEPASEPEADKPSPLSEAASGDHAVTEKAVTEVTTEATEKPEDDKDIAPSQQPTSEPTDTADPGTEPLDIESQIAKDSSTPNADTPDSTPQGRTEGSEQTIPEAGAEIIASTLEDNQEDSRGENAASDDKDKQDKTPEESRATDEPESAPGGDSIAPTPPEVSENSTETREPEARGPATDSHADISKSMLNEETGDKTNDGATDNEKVAVDPTRTDEGDDDNKGEIKDEAKGESVTAELATNAEDPATSTTEDKASEQEDINASAGDTQQKPPDSDDQETTQILQTETSTEAANVELVEINTPSDNADNSGEDPKPHIQSSGDTAEEKAALDNIGDDSRAAAADQTPEHNKSTDESLPSPRPSGDSALVADTQNDGKGDESEPSQTLATEVLNAGDEPAQIGDSSPDKVESEAGPDEGRTIDLPEQDSKNDDALESQDSIGNSSSTTPVNIQHPPANEDVHKLDELEKNPDGQAGEEEPDKKSQVEGPLDENEQSSGEEAASNTKGPLLSTDEAPPKPLAEESSSATPIQPEEETPLESKECLEEQSKPVLEPDVMSEETSGNEVPTTEEPPMGKEATVAEAESVGETVPKATGAVTTDDASSIEVEPAVEETPDPQGGLASVNPASEPVVDETSPRGEIDATENEPSKQPSTTEEQSVVQELDSAEISTEKDRGNDSQAESTPTTETSTPGQGLGKEETSVTQNEMAKSQPTTSEAPTVENDVQNDKTVPVIEREREPALLEDGVREEVVQAEPKAISKDVSETQSNVDSKEQVEASPETKPDLPTEDESEYPNDQIHESEASGEPTSVAEADDTREGVTEPEDCKSHEDSKPNELGETSPEPEKATVAVSTPKESIASSKEEGPDGTIDTEKSVARKEQGDTIKSQEHAEETTHPEESVDPGEQALSADLKDDAPSQVEETVPPKDQDMEVETQELKDTAVDPEEPKASAVAEEPVSHESAEEASIIPEEPPANEPGVVDESDVTKEGPDPAAVGIISNDLSEQTDTAVVASSAEDTTPEVAEEGPELLADKQRPSAVSNVQEEPQIAKDVTGPTDYEPALSDPKLETDEKDSSPQSEAVKESTESPEPIMEAKEEVSPESTPSQVMVESDTKVEPVGEKTPALEASTDCSPPKHPEDLAQGLSTKEFIERKVRMHKMQQMKEDDECRDTIGPIPYEDIAARRASKGEDQSVPSCVRDTPSVVANDFVENTPDLVPENVPKVEVLEKEQGFDEAEPGDESTARAQETRQHQQDDFESPSPSQVQEDKSAGPEVNPEDSQHLLEESLQENSEGNSAEDATRGVSKSTLPDEDPQPVHDPIENISETTANDKGLVIEDAQYAQDSTNESQARPQETLITDAIEGVTTGESKTELQTEVNTSETPESQFDKIVAHTSEATEWIQDTELLLRNETQEHPEIKTSPDTVNEPDSVSDNDHQTIHHEDTLEVSTPGDEVGDDNGSRDDTASQRDAEPSLQNKQSEPDLKNSQGPAKPGFALDDNQIQTTATPEEKIPTDFKASTDHTVSSLKPSQEEPAINEEEQSEPAEELKIETPSDNAIEKNENSENVVPPEQSVKGTSNLTVAEDTGPKGEVPDTIPEVTSAQEEHEAAMSQPTQQESEEQTHSHSGDSVDDNPVPQSGAQGSAVHELSQVIDSSPDDKKDKAMASISSQEPVAKGPSVVEESIEEDTKMMGGDENIQNSTPSPPADYIEELVTQKPETAGSPNVQDSNKTPTQEPISVSPTDGSAVKASTPEEPDAWSPDQATKALPVESHTEVSPLSEQSEERKPAQLEETTSQHPPSDNELISTQQSAFIEKPNVAEEVPSIKDDGENETPKEKSNIVPPMTTDNAEEVDKLHISDASESEIITSPSPDTDDDDFVLVERSVEDVPNEPVHEEKEPEAKALEKSVEEILPPVEEAIPEKTESDETQASKEAHVEPEVNESVTNPVIDQVTSARHKTSRDLLISTLESSIKPDSETPESPIIIEKAPSTIERDSEESGASISGSQVIIEREIDQGEILNTDPEESHAHREGPIDQTGTRKINASDKDRDSDSDNDDESRVDAIGSEVAGAAIMAAGSAMLTLKSSAGVAQASSIDRAMENAVESPSMAKSEGIPTETVQVVGKPEEIPDSSSRPISKGTEVDHPPLQASSSDDAQSTQKGSSVGPAVVESVAQEINRQLPLETIESPKPIVTNKVIEPRRMKIKRGRHAFFPDLVHAGTQTDEDLDFATLWDRNLQCFFDLANMEPRSPTPGVVLPDLSDSQAKALGRARSVKKQRRRSYKRAEATIAAAVIIYAATQQLSPPPNEKLDSPQVKDEDGKYLKRTQEPAQETHVVSSGGSKGRSTGRKEVSIADLSTDESSRSHHSDQHHRHRHHRHRHHHSSQSRDSNNSDEHHHHHRRHRRHRSSNPPVESYSDHSVSKKHESDFSIDSSRGHPSRRHRTPEEQAAHERRKAERRARESYEGEPTTRRPREAPPSDRQSYHGSIRSSRSHSEPHPPMKVEAPVTPTKKNFESKGHSVVEPKHAPRPTSRDAKEAPRPVSRDTKDAPRPVSRDTRDAPVGDSSRVEPSRHSVRATRPRRNSMDVRNTADIRNSADLSRSKSHRRYREDEDGSRRHRRDELRAEIPSAAPPPTAHKPTSEPRDEPRYGSRREERQRVREAEHQRKPSGFRATLKKLFA